MEHILSEAATYGDWDKVPKSLLNEKGLLYARDCQDKNVLHLAAESGELGAVPKSLLCKQLILERDCNGSTVLHHATSSAQLTLLPKTVLTSKNMSIRDSEGSTVYHYAASYGLLQSIPKNLVREKDLLTKNIYGMTPFDNCAQWFWETEEDRDCKTAVRLISKCNLEKALQEHQDKAFNKTKIKVIQAELSKRAMLKQVARNEIQLSI